MKLWFKAKRYGYGWYPSSWEGWIVLLAYLVLLLAPFTLMTWLGYRPETEDSFVIFYLPYTFVLTLLLIWICRRKGEPAKWRWGRKD